MGTEGRGPDCVEVWEVEETASEAGAWLGAARALGAALAGAVEGEAPAGGDVVAVAVAGGLGDAWDKRKGGGFSTIPQKTVPYSLALSMWISQ